MQSVNIEYIYIHTYMYIFYIHRFTQSTAVAYEFEGNSFGNPAS